MDSIRMAQETDRWRALVTTVMNLQVSEMPVISCLTKHTVILSKITLFQVRVILILGRRSLEKLTAAQLVK